MENFIKEYPKLLATVIVGSLAVFLSGKISAEYLAPALTEPIVILMTGVVAGIGGYFSRLTKSKARILKQATETSSPRRLRIRPFQQ